MSIYDNLIKDSGYMEIHKRYKDLEEKVKRSRMQKIDSRVARHYFKREAQKLETDYIEFLRNKQNDLQEKKRQARLKHERPVYDDPAQEMLRRQDMQAKLDTLSQEDLRAYIRDLRADDITAYDYNQIMHRLENREGLEYHISDLKGKLSVDSNEDYKALEEQEIAFFNLHGGFNGQELLKRLWTFDGGEDGNDVNMKDIQSDLGKLFEEYRTPAKEVQMGSTMQFMKEYGITDDELQGTAR